MRDDAHVQAGNALEVVWIADVQLLSDAAIGRSLGGEPRTAAGPDIPGAARYPTIVATIT
jgi:hypothetical protein